jgi:1-acyl-sn-glycerol-3-phosphate acyltransferase
MCAGRTAIARTHEHKLSDSFVYDVIRFIASPFSYDITGFENIQSPGPAIYIANHLGTVGPIETILSIPIRFYPWIIAEMTDFKRAPRYLFDDFVHPVLHMGGKIGLLFSTLLTKISVRLLKAIGAVSIDRFGGWTPDGFRNSLRLLHEGKNLLIFPEDPLLPLDPDTLMRPFMPGFAVLCRIFQAAEDTLLPVYPVAVHSTHDLVSIGKPEFFHSCEQHKEAIDTFCLLLENRVRGLYLDITQNANATLI